MGQHVYTRKYVVPDPPPEDFLLIPIREWERLVELAQKTTSEKRDSSPGDLASAFYGVMPGLVVALITQHGSANAAWWIEPCLGLLLVVALAVGVACHWRHFSARGDRARAAGDLCPCTT